MRGGLVSPGGVVQERSAFTGELPVASNDAVAHATPGVRPDALLYAVLGVILTDVWRLHDLIPAVRVFRPSIVLMLLGLVLVLAGRDLSRRLGRLRSPVAFWYAVLAGLILVGMPFSLDPSLSAQAFRSTFLPHAVAGFLVAVSVRSRRDVEFLALGLLAGAVVHTVFVHATVPRGVDGRWTLLPYYDVNDLALMLVVMIPLTVYFMRRGHSTARRLFAVACVALFVYSLVPTGSRGGFIGFAVVIAYMLLRYDAVPRRARLAAAAAAVIALAIGGQAYLSRLETILRPTQDYNWSEETGRLAIWRRGLGYVADRPLLGLGLGQFRTAERMTWSLARQARMTGRRPPPARGAHNMFLQVGAELGVPALLAFVALLVSTWRSLRRAASGAAGAALSSRAISGALIASLLGFVVCGLFLHAAFFSVVPVLLGLTVALATLSVPAEHSVRVRRGGLLAHGEPQSRRAV